MGRQLVLLKYMFLLDPDETWDNVWDFEKSLNKFLSTEGLIGQVIKGIEGQWTDRVLFIRKVEELKPLTNQDIPEGKKA